MSILRHRNIWPVPTGLSRNGAQRDLSNGQRRSIPQLKNISYILSRAEHTPSRAYKSCMGILGFEKKAGRERLIGACKRALDFEVYSFKAIQKILENNLDTAPFEDHDQELPDHHNIRGKHYYN